MARLLELHPRVRGRGGRARGLHRRRRRGTTPSCVRAGLDPVRRARLGGALARVSPAGLDRAAVDRPALGGASRDATTVVIDPGRAFGTGHPTTRLCLGLLVELDRGSLLDIGCGSGVLSVAGASSASSPSSLDREAAAVEAARRNAARNEVTIDVRRGDALEADLPSADLASNIDLRSVDVLAARLDAATLVTAGYFHFRMPRAPGFAHRERRIDGVGRRSVRTTVDFRPCGDVFGPFLGCKVSQADAQALRERLLADGHEEGTGTAEIAVVNGCCVTNEAVAKSRQAAARAARTHRGSTSRLRREPRRRCARDAAGQRLRDSGDTGANARARRPRRRSDRLRPGRGGPRSRSRLRQGAGRLQLLVQLLCDPWSAAARGAGAPPRCSPRSKRARQGHREVVLTGINLGCCSRPRPASPSRASCGKRARRPPRAAPALVDRDQPRLG